MTTADIVLPPIDDLHVHLRQGDMMRAVAKSVTKGGANRVLVMPNLNPPITTVDQAITYRAELERANPEVEQYFMTLYLSSSLTVHELLNAKSQGIIGVKSYPKGVTTGSEGGIEDYQVYYPIFAEMEKLGLSLHLHGEVPNACVMDAEKEFVEENLFKLHHAFPQLKIVLEHVTTAEAIDAVIQCGPTVAATITVHHLDLTISDVVGNNVNFCKPVAKTIRDRAAIRNAVKSGNPKFFLGSDSAPHPLKSKASHCCAPAGIFTQDHLAVYLADAFDRLGCLVRLENFACVYGAQFLGLPPTQQSRPTSIWKRTCVIPQLFEVGDNQGSSVVPYRAGETLMYSLESGI